MKLSTVRTQAADTLVVLYCKRDQSSNTHLRYTTELGVSARQLAWRVTSVHVRSPAEIPLSHRDRGRVTKPQIHLISGGTTAITSSHTRSEGTARVLQALWAEPPAGGTDSPEQLTNWSTGSTVAETPAELAVV